MEDVTTTTCASSRDIFHGHVTKEQRFLDKKITVSTFEMESVYFFGDLDHGDNGIYKDGCN